MVCVDSTLVRSIGVFLELLDQTVGVNLREV